MGKLTRAEKVVARLKKQAEQYTRKANKTGNQRYYDAAEKVSQRIVEIQLR